MVALPPEGIRRYLKPVVTRDPPTQRAEPPGTFSDVRLRWTVVSRVTSIFEPQTPKVVQQPSCATCRVHILMLSIEVCQF
ncbi:hypothetical protein CEXT_464851 [Caerostris extrusa]|uniref:Uncharacterized protein n=1 Tax=Caerostris extrusa TaxID=172846 RepID=A0AAV4Y669_CAEEX|nr:hypothetical protein CEXT_464851 [Caerostris extrusa]